MAATMKDVAKKAGLSVGTVSNYINGKSSVTESNRKKIEEAITFLGYHVNEAARNLKSNRSMLVGVMIPSYSNLFATRVLSHLEHILKESGFSIQVESYSNNNSDLTVIANKFIGRRVDGMIIMPSLSMKEHEVNAINKMIKSDIPVVIFDSADDGLECDHVVLNNYDSIKSLTNLLFDMGHKNIGLLLGPKDIYSSKERLSAYIDVHKNRGVQVSDDYVMFSNYSKSEGKENCDYLFQQHPEVTVIITAGYRMTLGALASITRKSLSVPEDISIVGFDIADIADILPNHLTGISLPVKDIAVAVGDIMLKRMNSDMTGFPLKTEIKTEFLQGSSARWI